MPVPGEIRGASRPFKADPERSAALRRKVEVSLEQPASKPGNFHIYIVTNKIHTVLYIGMTGYLPGRIYQHRARLIDGFTRRYRASKLIYFECFPDQEAAEKREKQLKGWRRSKKLALIEKMNPHWLDLFRPMMNAPDFNPLLVDRNASNDCSRDPSTSLRCAPLRIWNEN
jgi:putative endonuclease